MKIPLLFGLDVIHGYKTIFPIPLALASTWDMQTVALKADSVFIPNEVKSVKLTELEKNDLKEGKAVYLEGMLSEKGKEFNAQNLSSKTTNFSTARR